MRRMKNKCQIAVYVLFVCVTCRCTSAYAQGPSADGIQQFAEFGDFKLRDGGVIHEFRLGYRTLGKLNSSKSNVVRWPTWIGGKSQDSVSTTSIPAKTLLVSCRLLRQIVDPRKTHQLPSRQHCSRNPREVLCRQARRAIKASSAAI